MRLWLPRLALAAPALVLGAEILAISSRSASLLIAAVALWMSLPGIALVGCALRSATGHATPGAHRLSSWLLGPSLGFALSVVGLLLLWAAGVQTWVALALAPVVTLTLAWLAAHLGGLPVRLPALDRRDGLAVGVTLLLVPLVTWTAYAHVRAATPEGDAYRAYFTADFVWAMAATAELAKGDVPPVNPFLDGEPMRYYWMSHLLSGAIYRNVRELGVTIEEVVLIDGLAFGVAFVAFFYWLVRAVGASPLWSAVAVAAAFLANSYEGVDRLWALRQEGLPLDLVTTLNIDAVTRWFYEGMPVDGLQRLLLYQPHHLTGYACALAALWLVGCAEDVTHTGVALWAGILLALALLFSTFSAVIVGPAVGVLFAARLLHARAYRALWQCAVLGAAPIAVGVALGTTLGYTDPHARVPLYFGINTVALRQWPYMLLLSFGPLLLGGLATLARPGWLAGAGATPLALVVSALAFYFLADVPDMAGVWVGWRSGHLLLVAFAAMSAATLTAAWRQVGLRAPVAIVAAVALLLAAPTVAIDVYNAQDINNRGMGPGFPWTLIMTPAEREGLDWVRQHTPEAAVVQVEPVTRGQAHWAYVPAFGERRMAAGLPISMIPLQPYRIAVETVRLGIFEAARTEDAHRMATHLGIDYLLAGESEHEIYGHVLARFEARPDLFPIAFRNQAMTIYAVAR